VTVTWSALAEQRALEAVDYIAQDRPQIAAAWLEELIEQVGRLD
jgi:plasmid stabilization system protein ParE